MSKHEPASMNVPNSNAEGECMSTKELRAETFEQLFTLFRCLVRNPFPATSVPYDVATLSFKAKASLLEFVKENLTKLMDNAYCHQ